MSDPTIGATSGSQAQAQSAPVEESDETKNREISLADLMLLTMLDRAETLDAQIRIQTEVVERQNNQIKQLSELNARLASHKNAPKDKTQPQKVQGVIEPTWSVDSKKTPQEILLDNGNKLVFEGKDKAWSIVDAKGNSTRISGDLDVYEADGSNTWDFAADSTFILDDGTKIHVNVEDLDRELGTRKRGIYTHSLTITKGDQYVKVTGISDNEPVIGKVETVGGKALDRKTNDGHVFIMGEQGDDWLYGGKDLSEENAYGDTRMSHTLQQHTRYEHRQEEIELTGDQIKLSTVYSNDLLSDSDRQLLKALNITIYDASGTGELTIEEIQNLQIQIKDARDSVSSLSNIDLTKLDAYNKKYTQSLDLASGFMKSQYEHAKSLIRNIN